MVGIEKLHFKTEHSADDVWRAINTPLIRELGKVVHPFAVVEYEGLSPEEMIDLGTIIRYRRSPEATKGMSVFAAKLAPKHVDLRVETLDQEQRMRYDVIEHDSHEGFIRQTVETVDGLGVLAVEGDLSLGGKYRGLDDVAMPFVQKGVAEHYQRIVDNVPVILGQ